MARINGMEDAQLVGYGLVVGLNGTGDGSRTTFTIKSIVNMLRNLGVSVDESTLRVRNVAAVMVTANLKPFVKRGSRIDVNVSSLGDARSIEGGTLLMTPLQSTDGETYAVAQGQISVGGLTVRDAKLRQRLTRNHVLSGNIPNGALVKEEVKYKKIGTQDIFWSLETPDFTSAVEMADAINNIFPNVAKAQDASTIRVQIPNRFANDVMGFISRTENVKFKVDAVAKVILNERTGTVVSGSDVTISEIAISHGNININIDIKDEVSQPNSISGGVTEAVSNETVQIDEDKGEVKILPDVTNVRDMAAALNSLGVSPRDIIAIFQAIKAAGALHAELIVM